MTDKARQGKARHHQSKKSKARQRQVTMPLTPQSSEESKMPEVAAKAAPAVAAPGAGKTGTAQYPYVAAELRTIGILAIIIVVILIVLALVLT